MYMHYFPDNQHICTIQSKEEIIIVFSFLEYLYFILEIFMFLFYANGESDDGIGGSSKTAQHITKNNSRNTKAMFFGFGTSNAHRK